MHLDLTLHPLGDMLAGLVHGGLAVLVLHADEGAVLDQVLHDGLVVPEGGVVEGAVAVLVHKVHVGLVLQQLRVRKQN